MGFFQSVSSQTDVQFTILGECSIPPASLRQSASRRFFLQDLPPQEGGNRARTNLARLPFVPRFRGFDRPRINTRYASGAKASRTITAQYTAETYAHTESEAEQARRL